MKFLFLEYKIVHNTKINRRRWSKDAHKTQHVKLFHENQGQFSLKFYLQLMLL